MKPTNKNLLITHFSSTFNVDTLNDILFDLKKNDGKDMLYILDQAVWNIHKKARENLNVILNKRTFKPNTFKKETKVWELNRK